MTAPDEQTLLAAATDAARAGGEVLRRLYGAASLDVRLKGRNDLVSRADHESEEVVLGRIRREFPDHAILSEEGGGGAGSAAYQWVVDPLDGTNNFLQGLPYFCCSVGCLDAAGEPVAGAVYEPLADRLFAAARGHGATVDGEALRISEHPGLDGAFLATGYPFRAHAALDRYLACFREVFLQARGIRRCGSAALDLAHTAAGVFDGFFEFALSPWDVAAGVVLIREAGGVVTDLDGGERFLATGNLVAGGPGVHRELRAAVARHADEAVLAELTGHPDETPVGAG
ncbi:MAG: inositol monophosphatase family protein [Thermoanaerobaculia bacterium]